jgi:hypothetical protein
MRNATDFRFMHDVGRQNFKDDRLALGEMPLRGGNGFVWIAREAGRGDGNPVSRQDFADFDRIKPYLSIRTAVALQGTMQVAIVVVMTRFRAGI